MGEFLFYIGLYNALGSLVLEAMHDETPAPACGSARWAASPTGALGLIMVLAADFPESAQRPITLVAVGCYVVMWVVMSVGARRPKYGRGIWFTHGLWAAQVGWGLWAALR